MAPEDGEALLDGQVTERAVAGTPTPRIVLRCERQSAMDTVFVSSWCRFCGGGRSLNRTRYGLLAVT